MMRRFFSSTKETAMSVLGLQAGHGIGMDEVKKRYRELLLTYHPDHNKHQLPVSECSAKFTQIRAAYEAISADPDRHLLLRHRRQGAGNYSNPYASSRTTRPDIWGNGCEEEGTKSQEFDADADMRPKNYEDGYERLMKRMDEYLRQENREAGYGKHRAFEEAESARVERDVYEAMRRSGVRGKKTDDNNAQKLYASPDVSQFWVRKSVAFINVLFVALVGSALFSKYGSNDKKKSSIDGGGGEEDRSDEPLDFLERYIQQKSQVHMEKINQSHTSLGIK